MNDEILLLPAVGAGPADALAAGFVDALERDRPDARVTLIDLPLGGLTDRTGVDEFRARHLDPAAHAGRKVWVAGVSLGGWLALLEACRDARAIAGIALLAPWLGTREVHREIRAAGGLRRWAPAPVDTPEEATPGSLAEERAAWRFIAAGTLPLWLGFGERDRFGEAQSLAAEVLPADRVYVSPAGKHDWPCWADIWEHFLRWLPR